MNATRSRRNDFFFLMEHADADEARVILREMVDKKMMMQDVIFSAKDAIDQEAVDVVQEHVLSRGTAKEILLLSRTVSGVDTLRCQRAILTRPTTRASSKAIVDFTVNTPGADVQMTVDHFLGSMSIKAIVELCRALPDIDPRDFIPTAMRSGHGASAFLLYHLIVDRGLDFDAEEAYRRLLEDGCLDAARKMLMLLPDLDSAPAMRAFYDDDSDLSIKHAVQILRHVPWKESDAAIRSLLAEKVMGSGDTVQITNACRDTGDMDVERCQEIVIASGNIEWMRIFAVEVTGAEVKTIHAAMQAYPRGHDIEILERRMDDRGLM